ncbi:hypothetical protein L1987_23910 [Smallanthus sonchifolius]|uniref:Uncharacterized protein n=1 Tax=Smallanthus sonchifolius TaxID=185202 RepID=A0ACB9IKF5_9ASTR|nr:hypothetical protein L1987_23910 [Smallanthus sonchifolius]
MPEPLEMYLIGWLFVILEKLILSFQLDFCLIKLVLDCSLLLEISIVVARNVPRISFTVLFIFVGLLLKGSAFSISTLNVLS